MNRSRLLIIPLIALMVAFGVGVYFLWGATAHKAGTVGPARATPGTTQFTVPGTIVVAQDGNLYQLQGTSFTLLASGNAPQGSGEGWQQPAVTPDHQHLIAVKRGYNFSDLYELNMQGQVVAQLTNNQRGYVPLNQWAFFPVLSRDGSTLYYTYDAKQAPGDYQIDFSVYSMPLGGGQGRATAWTNPYQGSWEAIGTGGALQAVPLPGGGLIVVQGAVTAAQQTIDELWYVPSPLAQGTQLTPASETCYSPAISPDGTRIAMICSAVNGGATTQLVVAPLSGRSMGAQQVVAQGSMIASPTWSPDGQSLLFFDATGSHQLFQMDVLRVPSGSASGAPAPAAAPKPGSGHKATPTPTPATAPTPQALTTDNDFQATSAAVWF